MEFCNSPIMSNENDFKGKRILIADDEQVIRDVYVRALVSENYELSTCVNGLEAIERIQKDNFDMLILDLKMPKMDGIAVLNEIKRMGKDLAVIVVTGYATIATVKETLKLGCFDYLVKPFNIEELRITIKRAFNLKMLRDENLKLQAGLQQSERLASLAQMGAGVVHEVNTILTSIKLFLEMFGDRKTNTPKDNENVNLILEEINQAEKLTARFLSFTKSEKPEHIKIDIQKIIQRSLEVFGPKFKKNNINVLTDFRNEVIEILGDSLEIEEVLFNLFTNSIEAMPKGGALTVSSEVKGEKAVLIISDTGIGIRKEDIIKLFNPFFTTKPHGTGLGLAIVYRIIEKHKGAISITSEKDKGANMCIELPMC